MPLTFYPPEKQAKGAFNNGEILEQKPIGFPQDGGSLKPYSNLFYWAYAWAETESTIPVHPHKGFEIMSFVLEGKIEHYDNQLNDWITLEKGDVQIIRAGNGISHAEKLNQHAHMFQIWFDPDLNKSLQEKASYNDYKKEMFPIDDLNGIKRITYKGKNAPILMQTEDIEIEKWQIPKGSYQIDMKNDFVYSIFCLGGKAHLNEYKINQNDFIKLVSEKSMSIQTDDFVDLFLIVSPINISYKTFASFSM